MGRGRAEGRGGGRGERRSRGVGPRPHAPHPKAAAGKGARGGSAEPINYAEMIRKRGSPAFIELMRGSSSRTAQPPVSRPIGEPSAAPTTPGLFQPAVGGGREGNEGGAVGERGAGLSGVGSAGGSGAARSSGPSGERVEPKVVVLPEAIRAATAARGGGGKGGEPLWWGVPRSKWLVIAAAAIVLCVVVWVAAYWRGETAGRRELAKTYTSQEPPGPAIDDPLKHSGASGAGGSGVGGSGTGATPGPGPRAGGGESSTKGGATPGGEGGKSGAGSAPGGESVKPGPGTSGNSGAGGTSGAGGAPTRAAAGAVWAGLPRTLHAEAVVGEVRPGLNYLIITRQPRAEAEEIVKRLESKGLPAAAMSAGGGGGGVEWYLVRLGVGYPRERMSETAGERQELVRLVKVVGRNWRAENPKLPPAYVFEDAYWSRFER